ncbi:MAG: zinc dependent phospholipase C family protein [Chitinophagaceae bacterium]
MNRCVMLVITLFFYIKGFSWGFYAHQKINHIAVFLLPPEMMALYKPYLPFLTEHAVDPDKRRYAVTAEAPRHFMDMDHYKPWDSIPPNWKNAVLKYGEDSLNKHGIGPWWIQSMMLSLTNAFEKKDIHKIMKLSADLGHYIADIHVPLHASSNHNGQHSGQHGIHGFWESRIPELFTETSFDLFIGKASYIKAISPRLWKVIRQSALAADTVLRVEKELTQTFREDGKFSYENRNGMIVRQYSTAFSTRYHDLLNGMVERRMRESIEMVASCWYTAWVNAGQPNLRELQSSPFSEEELKDWDELNKQWKELPIQGRSCTN